MIDSYSFGKIKVDGKGYDHDIVVLPGRIIDWWRDEGHVCSLKDLDSVKKDDFDVLIIGTGASGMMEVLPEVEEFFKNEGIGLIKADTKTATEEFNRLSKTEKVVGAFHLTC